MLRIALTAAAAMLVLSGARAHALDYRIDFALELKDDAIQTGLARCNDGSVCRLTASLSGSSISTSQIQLRLHDLLFEDATHDTTVPLDGRKHQLGVFAGRARLENEVVVNPRVGTLTVIAKRTAPPSPK